MDDFVTDPSGDHALLNTPRAEDQFEQDWQDRVFEDIRLSEYHIRHQDHVGALQSPNRAQDLRITYHADGFSLTPRVESDRWHAELRVRSVGRAEYMHLPVADPVFCVEGAHAGVAHGTFTIAYTNDERGMRQDFHLHERLGGEGPVRVELQYAGDLHMSKDGEDAVLFSFQDSTGALRPALHYKELLAWDAAGDTLPAWVEVEDDLIALAVDDADATYPITIDPLSTTPIWTGQSNQPNAQYGWSVSTAGDVNGDGRSDIIVGAPLYDGGATNGGRAWVYHGTATGVSAIVATTILSTTIHGSLGTSVATAGDVNGDGYSDVLVILGGFPPNPRMLYIHHGSATGVSATPSTSIELYSNGAFPTGATAGDVNGDGFSDVVVGVRGVNSDAGMFAVYHGSASGLSPTPARTVIGSQMGSALGCSVASAGDVNNDGFSDVVIGHQSWTNGNEHTEEGRFMVYHGSATGISATPNFTYEGNGWVFMLGTSVSFAGDVNGDGYGDIIVGAHYYWPVTASDAPGAFYLFRGSATGITTTGMQMVQGPVNGSQFGASVCSAGDVNGDGLADVIVGAPRQHLAQPGSAFVYLGTSTGISTTPAWTVHGTSAGGMYGYSVAVAGDVNGDGYSDVLVGAYYQESGGQTDEGMAFCYLGSADGLATGTTRDGIQDNAFMGTSVSTAGDVNGDGYADVIVGAPRYDNGQTDEGRVFVYHGGAGGLAATASWTMENNLPFSLFGTSVATAGDVNGDGYSDVIIGAPGATNMQGGEGLAYVYNGSPSGLNNTPWVAERDIAGSALGSSVATAGDVNGDGYSDVVIGAPGYNVTQPAEGAAYVHFGSATGLNTTPDFTFTQGQANARIGACVAGAGDVTGDGYADVLVGAPGWTSGALTGRGRAFLMKGHPAGIYHENTWLVEGSHAGSQLGAAVSMAGDVNGDGYSDLLVGEPNRPNGITTNAGRVQCFHGAPLLPMSTPAWTGLGTVNNGRYGFAVSNAGDVNGDGYGDIVVGWPYNGNGRVHVHLGSPTGLSSTIATDIGSSYSAAQFGYSVSNSGSQSGDGFGDVVVGAPGFDGLLFGTDRGRAQLLNGNAGNTRTQRTRQYRTDQVTPVQPSNGTMGAGCGWTISQVARSHLGRRQMKLLWELRPHGPAFSGNPINTSTAYTGQRTSWTTVNAAAGVEIKEVVTLPGTAFPKWRARLRNHPATMIDGQPLSRWFYMGINDEQETAIKVQQPDCGLLPVELLYFEGICHQGRVHLEWATASERNSSHFSVQRSTDGEDWVDIDTIHAAGNSQQITRYAFMDQQFSLRNPTYYRLVQLDLDGSSEVFPVRVVHPCSRVGDLAVFPNPASERVHVDVSLLQGGTGHLVIADPTGRVLATPTVPAGSLIFEIPLGHAAQGSYVLQLFNGHSEVLGTGRFTRQ